VSAFGATEVPTTAREDAVKTCNELAEWVLFNHLDGVDLDWEDNNALESGTGEQWLITCTKVLRQRLPKGKKPKKLTLLASDIKLYLFDILSFEMVCK
jgi:hypothetical protein